MDNTELLTKVYGLLEERKKCSAARAAGYSLSDVRAAGYSLSDDELETLPTWLLESIKVSIQA